jgi:hypothetical protein
MIKIGVLNHQKMPTFIFAHKSATNSVPLVCGTAAYFFIYALFMDGEFAAIFGTGTACRAPAGVGMLMPLF